MNTYNIKNFIPQLIEQNPELLDELAALLKENNEAEIRLRDDAGVVYILGLTLEETTPKAELRRVKHKSHTFEPIVGKFILNASLASVLLAKQKETNAFIAEEESYNDNLDF
jgi:hypothetical protein